MQLEDAIEKIRTKARANDPVALQDALELTTLHPEEASAWLVLSYVHARSGHCEEAIADLNRAVAIAPEEPVLYFNRGRYSSEMGMHTDAISDYSRGIELCDVYNDDYYRSAFHFLRARSHLQLGDKKSALLDLSNIEDENYSFWIDGMITKKQLLSQCDA